MDIKKRIEANIKRMVDGEEILQCPNCYKKELQYCPHEYDTNFSACLMCGGCGVHYFFNKLHELEEDIRNAKPRWIIDGDDYYEVAIQETLDDWEYEDY